MLLNESGSEEALAAPLHVKATIGLKRSLEEKMLLELNLLWRVAIEISCVCVYYYIYYIMLLLYCLYAFNTTGNRASS